VNFYFTLLLLILLLLLLKPNIIIRDNEKGTCVLIDAAASGRRNVIKKEGQNILKYKTLKIEVHHMWNVQAKVTPVITP
jgi:hypothetical protein